jgi:F-type H+-transporting ATPase subunit epsilon
MHMAETLRLEIVTPLEIAVSEDVEMVTLPAIEGQIGVYPGHVRVITRIHPGEVIVQANGQERFLAVGEGLVEIAAGAVSIVTDMAIHAEKIDQAKAEDARARAEARLREKISDEEVATVNASLVRSLAQLQVPCPITSSSRSCLPSSLPWSCWQALRRGARLRPSPYQRQACRRS